MNQSNHDSLTLFFRNTIPFSWIFVDTPHRIFFDIMPDLVNAGIATIFAREFLEGAIIIGNYRTVIQKSSEFDSERKTILLKNVTIAASLATVVALIVILAVAIPLAILGNDLDEKSAEIIEGISKVVAAFCILQLSVKIPVWLGIYKKVSMLPWKKPKTKVEQDKIETLSLKEIRFNVAWNIWREVAECGIFLIPFFLDSNAAAVPISGIIGVAIALVLGLAIYVANQRMENKFWLAFFMSGLTLMLATGLFVGGCHEFEEVWGETRKVWKIENDFWSHKEFPMAILKPFGYSSSRTVLQITCFWLFLALGLFCHYLKWHASMRATNLQATEAFMDREQNEKGIHENSSGAEGSSDEESPGTDSC